MSTFLVSSLIVGAIAVYLVVIYNRLVSLRNRHANAFSQIDVQLQRRYELIPNLVEVAKEYMKHESETLTAVTNARNNANTQREAASKSPGDPAAINKLAQAEASLGGALGGFNLVMEDYPDLKADERMAELHRDLVSTENRVGFARQA